VVVKFCLSSKKEKQRWRVFEIRMLRKILEPKRKNIAGR